MPSSGRSAPTRHRRTVDLPAPLRPVSATASPEATSRLKPSTITTGPKALCRLVTLSTGVLRAMGSILPHFPTGREPASQSPSSSPLPSSPLPSSPCDSAPRQSLCALPCDSAPRQSLCAPSVTLRLSPATLRPVSHPAPSPPATLRPVSHSALSIARAKSPQGRKVGKGRAKSAQGRKVGKGGGSSVPGALTPAPCHSAPRQSLCALNSPRKVTPGAQGREGTGKVSAGAQSREGRRVLRPRRPHTCPCHSAPRQSPCALNSPRKVTPGAQSREGSG